MKKYNPILSKKFLFLTLLLVTFSGFAQTEKSLYTIGLANISSTATTLEMDVTFTIDSPTKGTKLSQITVGVNYNASILNDGTPCTTKNCGSWVYIGGKSDAIKALTTTVNTTNATYGHLRIVGTPLNYNSSIVLPNGTYTLGRYRFINSTTWTKNSNAQLWIQSTNEKNNTNTIISTFPTEGSKKLVAYSTTSAKNSKALALEYTAENPLSYVLNAKKITTDANFIAVASPNPFTDNFHIEVKTNAESTVEVKVYDMLGKLIENKTAEVSDIESVTIGSNYPAGIYNVTISQGESTQFIRIIKR